MKFASPTDSLPYRVYFFGRILEKFLSICEQVETTHVCTSYIIARQKLYNSSYEPMSYGIPNIVGRVSV